ncbi:MAG TPA: hypothetical protein VK968_01870, partial [Roseimicrobium sp.]|nr:hypothetical protein [Roseimicrobium sp.]
PGRATEMKGPELGSYCATHPASGLFAIAPKIGNAPFVAKIYATEQSALVEKLSLPLPGNVADLAFDADAARLAITYRSGRLEVFDVKTGASQLKRSSSIVRAAFAGPDGRLVALDPHTIKADAVEYHLQQLDGTTGKVLATVTNRFHVQAFAVSPDRKLIALGGSDRVVHLYDAETFREQAGFRAHDGDVGALTFHPTQPVLATASADGSVKLWEYRTGKLLDYFLGLAGNPVVLSFSPNGKLLMVDGQEHATRIYQIGKLDEGKAETVGARLAARAVRATPVAKVDRDGWTDVLSALTPEIVGEAGKGWRMDGGELFSPANAWATLPLPATLGGTSYQVRLRLRQLSPKDVFHLILPVGDQMVGFDLDGSPRSGFYTALLRVDGKGPMNAPGALHGKQVNDSGPHDLEATVRLADANAGVTITMKLDGRPLYEWTGPTTALSMYPEWNQIPRGRLAIGTWADDWVVSGLKVKRLDGK